MRKAKKLSTTNLKRQMRELRQLIDTTDDIVLARIAYAIRTAIEYVTEETSDWEKLVEQAKAETAALMYELRTHVKIRPVD